MIRQSVVALMATAALAPTAVVTAADAALTNTHGDHVGTSASQLSGPPVKRVKRAYGGPPVSVVRDQVLLLRFKGKRGDRVRLNPLYRRGARAHYGSTEKHEVQIVGPKGRVRRDSAGFYRLSATGRHTLRFESTEHGARGRFLLVKGVIRDHSPGSVTPLPLRRGFQYLVTLRAPRTGLDIVTFGSEVSGVISRGRYRASYTRTLTIGAGVAVSGGTRFELTEPLRAGEKVTVVIDASSAGYVETHRPEEAALRIDGPAAPLPSQGRTALRVPIEANPGSILRTRLNGRHDAWSIVVRRPNGRFLPPLGVNTSLFEFPEPGTYELLAVPRKSGMGDTDSLELDSLLDVGPITVGGPAIAVAAPVDGRWAIGEVYGANSALLEGSAPKGWSVYAGRLEEARCGRDAPLACGEGWGVYLGSTPARFDAGGHVLVMPATGDVTGVAHVQLLQPN